MTSILIIDDDAIFAELLTTLLEARGHDVLAVRSGRSALNLTKLRLRPELILVDLQMENMNGHQTIQALKREPNCAGAIVVMLTASRSDEAALEARKVGASGFLSKPIDPRLINDQVARLMGDPTLIWMDDHHTVVRAA